MITRHKNSIKILAVLTVTFLMAGCNGGGGSSSGVITSSVSSVVVEPSNILEEPSTTTEVFTEDFNNEPIIEDPLYIPERTLYAEELSSDVYTDTTNTTDTVAHAGNPEPATLALLGIGLLGLVGFKLKKVK